MGDSGSYIWIAITGWIPDDRSYFYGFVLRWTALASGNLESLLIVQASLGAVTAAIAAYICRSYLGLTVRWSYGIGFLCALDPLQLVWERYIMTETISLFFYVLILERSLAYLRLRRIRDLLIVQLVGVLLIGFRMSYLFIVQVNTVILPLIAFLSPQPFAQPEPFSRRTKLMLTHVVVSIVAMLSLKALKGKCPSRLGDVPNFPVARRRQEKPAHGVLLGKTSLITKGI